MCRNIILGVFFLSLVSCSSRRDSQETVAFTWDDFQSEINLKGRTLGFDDAVMMPFSIQVFDSVLVTLEPSRDNFCQLFNLNTELKIGDRLKRGGGPNEMIMPMFVSNGNGIQFIDMASSTVYGYDFNHFLSESSPTPSLKVNLLENVDSEMQVLGEHYVGYQYCKDSLLYRFDKQGKKVGGFAGFPDGKTEPSNEERSDIYQMGYVSNGKDRLVVTYYMTDIIEIYDADGGLVKHLQGPENFKFASGKDAFFSPKNAGDSFFVLYNGRSRNEKEHNSSCAKLLSFSWDGKPECVYTLDDPIFTFCVNKEARKIYGVSTMPEYHIVEYVLPE